MMAQGDASNIACSSLGPRERQSLLVMKALIERHLREMEEVEEDGAKGERGEEKVQEDVDMDMEL